MIAGGISKLIGRMTETELDDHLRSTIAAGAQYGSYIVRSEGGIPPEMTQGAFRYYLQRGREYRQTWRRLRA